MQCVYSRQHALHDPEHEVQLGTQLPIYECARRAEEILSVLSSDSEFQFRGEKEYGTEPIIAVHDPGMVRYLETVWSDWSAYSDKPEFWPDTMLHSALREGMGPSPEPSGPMGRLGYWCFETMTAITPGTYPAVRAAVDVALTATDLVLEGERMVYGLCRPPGHHAVRAAFGGYCYLNNAAIAAHHIAEKTGEPVAVLDVDYHHGNGTQQIFYLRSDVLYVSLHGDPNHTYPYYAGYEDEDGSGDGKGANFNFPLPPGCTADKYFDALEVALEKLDAWGGEIVVVSLGLDTFGGDPIADFTLSTDDLHEMGRRVGRLNKRLVILQEGGYNLTHLGSNARGWLRGALGLALVTASS
jgi:acetoin utilization deacetylase AcuC-like enzyme